MNLKHNFTIRMGLCVFIALFVFQLNGFSKCVYNSPLNIRATDTGNMLRWSTAEEQNIAFFVIQKSTDGIDFKKIGDVKGAGFSQKTTTYRFLDFCLPERYTYYRLLHYAPYGSCTTSATFYLDNSPQTDVRIMATKSSITNKNLGLTLASKKATALIYEVENDRGQVVYSGTQDLTPGENTLSIDCEAFRNGKYHVVLKTATERDRIAIHKVDSDKVPDVEFVLRD